MFNKKKSYHDHKIDDFVNLLVYSRSLPITILVNSNEKLGELLNFCIFSMDLSIHLRNQFFSRI